MGCLEVRSQIKDVFFGDVMLAGIAGLPYEIILWEHEGKGLLSPLGNRNTKWKPDYEASML